MAKDTLPFDSTPGPIPYEVVRKRGQKHINIRVHHDGRVTISAPATASDEKVRQAVKSKQRWICSHVERTRQKRGDMDELKEIPLGGIPHRITIEYHPNRRTAVRVLPQTRTILMQTGSKNQAMRLDEMAKFLKSYCLDTIKPEVESVSKLMRIKTNRISFRDQKTRWGSSSARGNISLNFRIALLPPEKRRYLIIHELAHQIHMNHSSEFWNFLAAHLPGYAECDAWLKEHSFFLGLFR